VWMFETAGRLDGDSAAACSSASAERWSIEMLHARGHRWRRFTSMAGRAGLVALCEPYRLFLAILQSLSSKGNRGQSRSVTPGRPLLNRAWVYWWMVGLRDQLVRHLASKRWAASSRSTAQSALDPRSDGRPGTHWRGGFRAEAGRYHLYISQRPAPGPNRTAIFRQHQKGSAPMLLALAVVHWQMGRPGLGHFAAATVVIAESNSARQSVARRSTPSAIPATAVASPVATCSGIRNRPDREQRNPRKLSGCSTSAFNDNGADPGDYYPEGSLG